MGDAPSELEGPAVVDLLHDVERPPVRWGDLRGSVELVRFAFEGGDCAGVFDTLIDALPLAKTTFDARTFASQLYLDDLLRHAFPIRIRGERVEPRLGLLRRVLEAPPADAAHRRARQAVLAELTDPAHRASLESVYRGLSELRRALEMATATEPNLVRRKIGVLVALQKTVLAMADGFEGASSRLAELRRRGRELRESSAYQRLADLIDLEGNMSVVDVRLTLGSDGTIRGFGVLAVRDSTHATTLPGPVMRFFQRILAFFRGHRYGENEVVVRLLEDVFAPFVDDVVGLLAMTGAVELYLATCGFRDIAKTRGLEVSLPEIIEEGGERVLEGLFNPLLFMQPIKVRTSSVPVPRADALVILTGPNSGGKTRLLQSIALAQLLGQVGLFVPAERATLVHAPGIFLSLVSDDDAGQTEGRLGTELARVRQLFEKLEPGSLALLDELCSGTNPDEGEAIFELVVSLLPALRPQLFVSTHFLGLAKRLEENRPVESLAFLQVELDADEKPTYRYVLGVATTSLAHKVAERLGVTRADLEALVRQKTRLPS